MKTIAIDFTPEEAARLFKTGFIEIDDPERGHITVTMMFGENNLDGVGSYSQIKVIRSGSAASMEER